MISHSKSIFWLWTISQGIDLTNLVLTQEPFWLIGLITGFIVQMVCVISIHYENLLEQLLEEMREYQ